MDDAAVEVEAAGAVVWRRDPGGGLEVLLVHRPRYDDWSLPKGKLIEGEEALAGALREVEEETGLYGEVGPELAETRYADAKGRDKRVRYWAMRATGGSFQPNDEVDEVRWLALDAAVSLLSHAHDVAVVAGLGSRLG
ncbi:MAG TPA: NUDIX hydrolase [Acidimicrobiales bacterium]